MNKTTKDGLEIVAQGCAEDNSGTLVALPTGEYGARMRYAIGEDAAGKPVYDVNLGRCKTKAIEKFKAMLGSFGHGE